MRDLLLQAVSELMVLRQDAAAHIIFASFALTCMLRPVCARGFIKSFQPYVMVVSSQRSPVTQQDTHNALS